MNRRRKSHSGLTNSRIYAKGKRFYLFSPEPIENPRTGKVAKWHPLCDVAGGEDRARELANEIQGHNRAGAGAGDMPIYVEKYRLAVLKKREQDRPREPARAKMFEAGGKELTRLCRKIAEAFADFDTAQVLPVDVAAFVDQWEGQRMGQVFHARLSGFFSWACRRGLRDDNPCREVQVEAPGKRDTYITHAQYHAIRDALLLGENGRPTPSGPMVQCYVDLCYLLYQRTTEIRLLKWSDVGETEIFFRPTKTEKSSGAKVAVPITTAIRAVLERARACGPVKGLYVIHTAKGQPYSRTGIGSAWKRACQRTGVTGLALKDLRAKALTDAKGAGYRREQLQVAAAHSDAQMTERYIRLRETPVSEVTLELPARPGNRP